MIVEDEELLGVGGDRVQRRIKGAERFGFPITNKSLTIEARIHCICNRMVMSANLVQSLSLIGI
jgi:hypothetical protein